MLSNYQSTQQYPVGNLKRAKRLNVKGLKARKRGDNARALRYYRKAVAASPRYGWARFNLACELSLAGREDEAIEHLLVLHQMNTEETREILPLIHTDHDFDNVRHNPAFRLLAKRYRKK